MATRTTSQAGPISASATFGGASFANGDTVVANHALTIDTSVTIGSSPPNGPTTYPTFDATGGGAGGGSLPATGTVLVWYTYVDAGGKESSPSAENGGGISAGNIPRITFPALPAWAASRNLYCGVGAGRYNGHLYASGITGTTYDMSSASWTNGTTSYAAAAEWVNNGLTTTAAVTVDTGVTLTMKGNVLQGNANFTVSGTGKVLFDVSANATTADPMYVWFQGRDGSQTACKLTTRGTAGNRAEVGRTGSTGWFVFAPFPGPGTGQSSSWGYDSSRFDCEYTTFSHVINPNYQGVTSPGTYSYAHLFTYCTFDDGYFHKFVAGDATGGWFFSHCTWKNSQYEPTLHLEGGTSPSADRKVWDSVFDKRPTLNGNGSSYRRNYFKLGFGQGQVAALWADFTNNLVRNTDSANQPTFGPVTGCYFLGGTLLAHTDSGTATAGGASTLTDSGKAWSVNQFVAGGGGVNWAVRVVSGTGAGQLRLILTNTATALTVSPAWETQPTAGSTYRVFQDQYNPHFFTPAAVGSDPSGCVWEHLGADTQGDCVLASRPQFNVSITNNLFLPNGARYCSGVAANFGIRTGDTNKITFDHNTVYQAAGGGIVEGDFTTDIGGLYASVRSNLFWQDNFLTPEPAAAEINGDQPDEPFDVCDYNALHNSTGYAVDHPLTTYGAHDVALGTGGAGAAFVAGTRGFVAWAASLGSTGTTADDVARAAVATLEAANDDSGGDPDYYLPDLVTWVRAGFAPTNTALKDAGHDSVTIGAVEGVWSSAATLPLVGGGLINGGLISGGLVA